MARETGKKRKGMDRAYSKECDAPEWGPKTGLSRRSRGARWRVGGAYAQTRDTSKSTRHGKQGGVGREVLCGVRKIARNVDKD